MRRSVVRAIGIAGLALASLAVMSAAQDGGAATAPAATAPGASGGATFDELILQLGDENFDRRDGATRALIAQGPTIGDALRDAFGRQTDAEIRHRIRYILENVTPPALAVLVASAEPTARIEPGELITHVSGKRVRTQQEFQQRMDATGGGAVLRVAGLDGPREVGPISRREFDAILDYVAPRGQVIARAIRLYATGYVEQAHSLIESLYDGSAAPPGEGEVTRQLRARIAFTAGHGQQAISLLEADRSDARPATAEGSVWSTPSRLDTLGPGKAPLHLEWSLFTAGGPDVYRSDDDPDLRIQRVLGAAARYEDALLGAADLWWREYRQRLLTTEDARPTIAGNQLAVIALMLWNMGLRSECCRLIEPRSEILRRSFRGRNKWVRVETDAWLAFIAGDSKAAVDGFYEDALDVLQQPPRMTDGNAVIRNPFVAARIAFFLYQPPVDRRCEDALDVVNHAAHPALTEYLDWMLRALEARNEELIRRHLQASLPSLADSAVVGYARAVALLEAVQPRPDADVIATARQRVFNAPRSAERDDALLVIDVLAELASGHIDRAKARLREDESRPGFATLRSTVEFLSNPPAEAGNHDALRGVIAAVPVGANRTNWLVVARDRRLMLLETDSGRLTAIAAPEPGWFPSPLNWPWIASEPSTGRAWTYGRRRVIELTPGAERPLRMNIEPGSIVTFDRLLGSHFSRLADAVSKMPPPAGENGEFLREQVKANQQFLMDPDLPELAVVRELVEDDRVVHFALRGGPHVLVESTSGRAWTSPWIQSSLKLDAPPAFMAQALWRGSHGPDPVVMLMSDQGLIRFDLGTETLTRLPLPEAPAYPALVPESMPYVRRDAAFFYFARAPLDGGAAYRLTLASGAIEKLDVVNESLPTYYYALQTRSQLRAGLDARLRDRGMLGLVPLIEDAEETVKRWAEGLDKP